MATNEAARGRSDRFSAAADASSSGGGGGRRASPRRRPLLLPLGCSLAICCYFCCCCWRPVGALVSYCRDSSPHSYSHPQAEAICETEGQYSFPNQKSLLDDLGDENVRRRYTAMKLEDQIVAKYANASEFILHVEVLNTSVASTAHHCCQVCQMDCEQLRYVCPRRFVDADDNCSAAAHEFSTCRFTENLLDVVARIVCAVKVSKSRDIPPSWYSTGFTLRTSPRNCPYRKLESGAHYVLLATLSTPNYGRDDTLTGADMVIAIPKKFKKQLPMAYLKGVNLGQGGYDYLTNATQTVSTCPSAKSIRALSLRSAAAPPPAAAGHRWASLVASAASLAFHRWLSFDDIFRRRRD